MKYTRIRKIPLTYLIIATAVIIRVILYQIALFHSGYTTDELLHIDAGNHLAFGYMDFPPMIALLAWLQNIFQTDSLFVHHFFLTVAGALVLVFSGLTTMKLGGNWLAVLLTSVCFLFSPGFNGNHFSPTFFEILFWVICFYYMIQYFDAGNEKYLLFIGIFAALGFLSKYSIVFLFAGFIISVLLFQRNLLIKRKFWIGILLFLIIVSPNLWWQYHNQFPILKHMSELYDTQLNQVSFWDELKTLTLFLNPAIFAIILAGLIIIPFNKQYNNFKVLSSTLLFATALLLIAKGKFYYFFTIVASLIPFASVFIVKLFRQYKSILYLYTIIIATIGIVYVPHVLPVFKLEKYIELYGLKPNEDKRIPLNFDNYYSDKIWPQILDLVKKAYDKLPPDEQKQCLVWGRHYSHAGGINLLGKKYGLPEAFSFHSSYYNWVPDFNKDITIIAIGESEWTRDIYLNYFEEVVKVGEVENPYATSKSWYNHNIFLCRKLKYNSNEMKALFKNEIY